MELKIGATKLEKRVFLFEDEHVVEGPSGWSRGENDNRRPSIVWTKKTKKS